MYWNGFPFTVKLVGGGGGFFVNCKRMSFSLACGVAL